LACQEDFRYFSVRFFLKGIVLSRTKEICLAPTACGKRYSGNIFRLKENKMINRMIETKFLCLSLRGKYFFVRHACDHQAGACIMHEEKTAQDHAVCPWTATWFIHRPV